jgi:hypothetical protein
MILFPFVQTNAINETIPNNSQKSKKPTTSSTTGQISSLINDEIKRANKPKVKQEPKTITQNYNQSLPNKKEEVRNYKNQRILFFVENNLLV